MTNEERLKLAGDARINEIEMRWTMFQLFFLIHSGALSLIFIYYKPKIYGIGMYFLVSLMGLYFSFIWLAATYRAQKLIDYWHRKMALLEELIEDELVREHPAAHFVRVFFNPRERTKVPNVEGIPLYRSLMAVVWAFIAIWSYLSYSFFSKWLATT